MITRWFQWVLRSRVTVLVIIAALSGVSAVSLSNAVIATSMVKLFLGDDPAYPRYVEWTHVFGSDEALLVGYASDGPLAVDELQRLDAVVRVIEALPEVARVESVLSAERVSLGGGTLAVERYADLARGDPLRIPQLVDELRADPRAAGLVISPDGHNGAVLVRLRHDKSRPAESGPALVRAIEAAFEAHGFAASRLHVTGFLALISALLQSTVSNLLRLFPITLGVMVLAVHLLLRRLLPVLVAVGVALLAVLWTMGFSTALDPEVNILVGLVPAVILVVAISDVVHLWSAYLIELEEHSREQAILRSASDVGLACLFTSATTFLGFISLAFIPTPVYRHLGVVMGFGVAVALLLAMTLMPVLLSYLPAPTVSRVARSRFDAAFDGALAWIARVTVQRRWGIVCAFALATVPMAYGISQFQVDTDPLARMDADSKVRKDAKWFDASFAGTNFLELYIETDTPGGALEPELLRAVAELEREIEAWPEVDVVVSLADAVAETHKAFAPDLYAANPLPDDAGIVSEYLFLFELSGGDAIDQLVDADRQRLRLMARLPGQALRGTHEVGLRAMEAAARHLPPGARLEASGLTYLFGGFIDQLLRGQNAALAFSALSVAFMMVLGLRSVRVGLWSMIPNALPTVVVLGCLGLLYDKADSDSLIALLLAVGIGVDDTIHFLMRYRLERQRHTSAVAIERTFSFAGRAIVQTTIILALGFLPLALSDYLSIRLLGILLPIALVVALIADLFLLPALTAIGWVRFDTQLQGEEPPAQ